MRCPPHRTPSGTVLVCVCTPSKCKRERGLLEPWGMCFQSCRITAKGCLAEAPSPRGISLLPRDLIKALTIHLPGIPVMSNLHLKATVSFPKRLFSLHCTPVASRGERKKKKEGGGIKPPTSGSFAFSLCPTKKFQDMPHPEHCSAPSFHTNASGRISTASQTR